jgi:hypothetical protein
VDISQVPSKIRIPAAKNLYDAATGHIIWQLKKTGCHLEQFQGRLACGAYVHHSKGALQFWEPIDCDMTL